LTPAVEAAKDLVRWLLPPGLLRWLYRRMTLSYIAGLSTECDPSRKTVLVVNHLYDQDIRALQLANNRYNLVVVDFEILFKSGRLYITESVRNQRAPYGGEPEENLTAFRQECRLMLESLGRKFELDVIVAPSDGLAFIREFIVAAREDGIPTVILDKEGAISPHAFDIISKRLRDFAPFISDHLYVWSDRQVQFWNNIGVSSDKITVVGQARSDLFFREKNRDIDALFPVAQPLIGYFSFDDSAYMPRERLDAGWTWRKLKHETLDDLMTLAEENPGYNFVVKAHPQQLDLAEIRAKYRRDNLVVVGGAQIANELIQRSELIIGFQTTGMIEAMFLKRRVIYTAWDDNYRRALVDDLLPLLEARGIVIADTRSQFNDVCRRFFAGDVSDFEFGEDDRAARDRFVNEYLYRPDGHVCERFYDELDRFLSETTIQ
jgi:hypothetical protein